MKKLLFKYFNISDYFFALDHIIIYLKLEIPKIYLNKGINEEEFYKYHYENFLIRVAAIPDMTAIVTEQVFELQMIERYINCQGVLEHQRMKENITCNLIKQFNDLISTYKSERHIVAHRGGYTNDKLSMLNVITPLSVFQSIESADYKKHYKKIIMKEKNEYIHSINELIQVCKNNTYDILDSLIIPIEIKMNKEE